MAPSYPSIQSFYKREVQKPTEKPTSASSSSPPPNGDGFTEKELEEALDPLSRPWNPEREYEEATIDQLVPGPKNVRFIGRVVNFNTIFGRSAKQPKAAGWHYLIVKDNTAAISLKLYFAHKSYPLKLNVLITIWTAFISDMTKSTSGAHTLVSANLFPGRNTSDHILLHTRNTTNDICNIPLSYKKNHPLPGLMTLESYLSGGHEIPDAKILVCIKSIGAKKKIAIKKISNSNIAERDLCEVMLFDHTGETKLNFWGEELYEVAKEWIPSSTVLLISSPMFRLDYGGKGTIGLKAETMVEVDPECEDGRWLRRYAVGRTKREGLCLGFPEGVFDEEGAVYGVFGALFTLAEVDEWVRDNASQTFTGWINVTILDLSLATYHRKNMLLCAECCGIPHHSNTTPTPCPHCLRSLNLTLNPKTLGALLDETGCITPGKLVWSTKAWEELLGRSVQKMAKLKNEEVRWLEQRLVGLRLHLCFGWDEGVGRLCVLGMRP